MGAGGHLNKTKAYIRGCRKKGGAFKTKLKKFLLCPVRQRETMNVSLVEKEHGRSWLSDPSGSGRHEGLWGEETKGRKGSAS